MPSRAKETVMKSQQIYSLDKVQIPTIGIAWNVNKGTDEQVHEDDIASVSRGVGHGILRITVFINKRSVHVMEHISPDFSNFYPSNPTVPTLQVANEITYRVVDGF